MSIEGEVRIAFCGASGTGKTSLAENLASVYGLPMNPVGSRQVAKEMGFDSPYDVDAAGLRVEFQRRLMAAKAAWEAEQPRFISDRTVFDNLTYFGLHSPKDVRDHDLHKAIIASERYTHIILFPMDSFRSKEHDAARLETSEVYHKMWESICFDFVCIYARSQVFRMHKTTIDTRFNEVVQIANIKSRGESRWSSTKS